MLPNTAMRRLGAFVVAMVLAWGILSLVFPVEPVAIHVRWASWVTGAQRVELERQFQLQDREQSDGTTWSYRLADPSTDTIRALVQDEHVEDTDGLDRNRYRPVPEISWIRRQRGVLLFLASGIIGAISLRTLSILLIIVTAAGRRAAPALSAMRSDFTGVMPSNAAAPTDWRHNVRVTAAVLLSGVLIGVAMWLLAGANLGASLGALVVVYTGGYLVGSLLVARVERLSFAIVRTSAGLMLTSVGFLLSLVLYLPWFVVPGALLVMTLILRGRTAFAWPHEAIRVRWDGVAAGMLVAILVSPIAIAFFRMAPGPFPPVFYNVDTAYGLEKVHALVIAHSFPPPSLSNLGVTRTYHYGIHAMAALISRGSGLLPHHALFLIVLPLLAVGTVAAAVAAARELAPALPLSIAMPLMLIAAPYLTRSFSDDFGPRLWAAATSGRFTLDWIVGDYDLWGIFSNEAQNTDFLILGSIAGMAAAPVSGWVLPAFLIGSSVLFKTTTGIALVSGFMLAAAWQGIASRQYRPLAPTLLVAVVFAATFGVFFIASFSSAFRVELYPLEHLRGIVNDGRLVSGRGFLFDSLWLFLPALIVLTARGDSPERLSIPLLLMAVAPLLVINMTRLVHVGNGGEGAGLDWVQIPRSVPFLVHAFALSLAGTRWRQLGRPRRLAFFLAAAVVIAPVVIAAEHYSSRLLRVPESGHEFVDNRTIAEALQTIPTEGSIIVTNDLRYPADNFGRDDRQMQIPALFGHQAFSANFSYEPVEDRRELQQLLQRPEWTDAISTSARRHHWTHLVIRKDYVHPSPIPLKRIFENDSYAVYQFP
jgi:hypothetical protein